MNKFFKNDGLDNLIREEEWKEKQRPITQHREMMGKEQELKEKKIIELKEFLKSIAGKLKEEGVPIADDCRINIGFFNEKRFPKLKEDLERVNGWQEELENKKINPEEQKETAGEQLEMLKTAVFNKFMGKKFIVVRSSKIDDFDGGIDNVIMEKTTGNIVSAFDEVSDEEGEVFRKKASAVMDKNKLGTRLKYGLSIDPTSKRIIGQTISNIPIFYLPLSKKNLEEAIKNFSTGEPSKNEEELFEKFMSSIFGQIKELYGRNDIPFRCKEKIKQFADDLKQI
jgi:hypothetical protein